MFIYLITRNSGKLMAAKHVFDKHKIELRPVEKDYPEIQSDTSLSIAKFTALQVAQELGKPAIREDHSLFIDALGIPGPYTRYIEKKISAEKLIKILNNFDDRSGFFEIATVYAEPNGFTMEYSYKVPIRFSKEEKGNLQGGWSKIIILDGETRTLAEYPEKERIDVWSKNYESIADFIKERTIPESELTNQ